MRASERVKLIGQICQKLQKIPYSERDMILRQFGVPWSENWNGDVSSYCLRHVEQGNDATLVELYEHLFEQQFDGGPRGEADHLWEEGFFRLFLSHVSSSNELMVAIKSWLIARGVDAFLAHDDIEPTKEWLSEIHLALETCDALAACLTPSFHQSFWTDQEIGFCIKRRVPIIPVRMGLDPYGFMGRYQALNASGKNPPEIAEAIFEVLLNHQLSSDRMASAVV